MKRGFSLVELLAVIGVLSVLAALLLPTMEQAVEQGRRTVCLGNLRGINFMSSFYAEEFKGYLPFKTNVHAFTFPYYFPRTALAGYGLTDPQLVCPSGPAASLPYGHYSWHGGGFAEGMSTGFPGGWCAVGIRLQRMAMPSYWPVVCDILVMPMASGLVGSAYEKMYSLTLWKTSHPGGMSVALADGTVKWFAESECVANTPEAGQTCNALPSKLIWHRSNDVYHGSYSGSPASIYYGNIWSWDIPQKIVYRRFGNIFGN